MLNYFIEIKNRVFLLLTAIISVFFVSYFYKEIILFSLVKPSLVNNHNIKLFYFIFTDITEIFYMYLNIIFFVVIQIFLILSIYYIFNFLSLALYKKEHLLILKLLKTCLFAWIFSIFLARYFLIPFSWEFFFGFQSLFVSKFVTLHFEPKISEYLEFCLLVYSTCIFYFQVLSILIFFITYFNNNIKNFKKYKKLYFYSFVIFSTFITPPDVFSQIFLSLFLLSFYELFTIFYITKMFLTRKIIKTN